MGFRGHTRAVVCGGSVVTLGAIGIRGDHRGLRVDLDANLGELG